MANDWSDASCLAQWRFESGALTTDSKGSNTLTAVNTPTEDTTNQIEGSCCANLDRSSAQYFEITDANLPSDFPGKNGGSIRAGTYVIWVRMTAQVASTNYGIIGKGMRQTGGNGVFVYNYAFYHDWDGGWQSTSLGIGNDTWWRVVWRFDFDAKKSCLDIYNPSTQQAYQHQKNDWATSPTPGTHPFRIGCFDNGTWSLNGKADETVVIKRWITDAEVETIFADSFPPPDHIQVEAVALGAVWTETPAVEVNAAGLVAVWSEAPLARATVDAAGLTVVWTELPGLWSWLTNCVNLDASLTRDSTWRILDLSSLIPSWANIAIIKAYLSYGSTKQYAFQPMGMATPGTLRKATTYDVYFPVKLDENRQCRYYIQSANPVGVYLMGYAKDPGTWLDSYVVKTPSLYDHWVDCDCSAQLAAGDKFAWFQGWPANLWGEPLGLRMNGSSVGETYKSQNIEGWWAGGAGLDGNLILDQAIYDDYGGMKLIGASPLWQGILDPITINLATTAGAWTDLDLSTYVPEGTSIIYLFAWSTSGFGIRAKGSSDTQNNSIGSGYGRHYFCGVDASRLVQYRATAAGTMAVVGYYPIPSAPPGIVVPVSCQEIGIESPAVTAFWEYKRKFPVFDEKQQFETQAGKQKYPWLT